MEHTTLVLGIGNYLMGDEGIGVHLVEHLQREELPAQVTLLDGGTGGFHLLEYFEQHERVIIIDATLDGGTPGTIRQIRPRFAADFPKAMSTHDIGLKDMVSALQLMGTMPEIELLVVTIETIQQQGTELTPEIAAVMPDVIAQVKSLLCLETMSV